MTYCTILIHPTYLTRTQTICTSTRFIVRRADQGTVFTIIPMLASCKNQSASKYQYDPTGLTKQKLQALLWQFFFNYFTNSFQILIVATIPSNIPVHTTSRTITSHMVAFFMVYTITSTLLTAIRPEISGITFYISKTQYKNNLKFNLPFKKISEHYRTSNLLNSFKNAYYIQ